MSDGVVEASTMQEMFRALPQVDEFLRRPEIVALAAGFPRALIADAVRKKLAEVRGQIREGQYSGATLQRALDLLAANVEVALQHTMHASLRPVINATGVVLQTNLGRAPLCAAAIARVAEIATGYSNLELDLSTGERGHRDSHGEGLILAVLRSRLAQPEQSPRPLSAAVVNNCAAACFLALNTLAEGGEVLVSRGELVEIGGGFRVPDILRKSGAVLREVGTTNRTRIADYANAITPQTKLILRVHRSNFRIEGFTEQPSLRELRELGQRSSVPVFEDEGTGSLLDLSEVGIDAESSWLHSIDAGLDLVACSGDKLLGGPQCGILVGLPEHIERIRANPLFRAMRVDKLTYAALQATLLEFLAGHDENIPVIRMIQMDPNDLVRRCDTLAAALSSTPASVSVTETRSVIGGGTSPGATLPGYAVGLQLDGFSESTLAARLREAEVPVLCRIRDGRLLLDLRTVFPEQDDVLVREVSQAIMGLTRE